MKLRGLCSSAHLERFALDAVRLVHKYIRTTTNSNSARGFVKSYSLESFGIVDVDRLEERLRTAEND